MSGAKHPIHIHYHRDFDGMVAGAVLAKVLMTCRDEKVEWHSVNYDQRKNWDQFERGRRFAVVDFHFHPRAEYWFDHHPTTFLSPELREQYAPSENWHWDENSPSCPPIILKHAEEHWGYKPDDRFKEMAHWSDIIDAAKFRNVDQALFGDEPALRIMRCLSVAPSADWPDRLVEAMIEGTLTEVADRPDVEKAYQRAARNRDRALEHFPPTVLSKENNVLLYDASSNKIRRERFAPFFHHPEIYYSVGVIPTRGGYHVSAGENPWNTPPDRVHIGELMEKYGGGGHRAVGGANPPNREAARKLSAEIAEIIRKAI